MNVRIIPSVKLEAFVKNIVSNNFLRLYFEAVFIAQQDIANSRATTASSPRRTHPQRVRDNLRNSRDISHWLSIMLLTMLMPAKYRQSLMSL